MIQGFTEGQHIVVEQLIEVDERTPVPPGRYVVAEVTHDLLGNTHYRIRSLPDEDLEVEVDEETLSELARTEEP